MAPHSSTLAWKIPWTEEPGRLQSMGSLRVGHDWATSLWLFTFMHWRGQWQPTSVFLPGESQGRGSLVGCRLWGHTESDTAEQLNWTELKQCIKHPFCTRHPPYTRHPPCTRHPSCRVLMGYSQPKALPPSGQTSASSLFSHRDTNWHASLS